MPFPFSLLVLLVTQAGSAPGPADSAAVLDAARAAQAAFERLRIDHLPAAMGSSGAECDEIVGRFCFWHGDDDDWVPPPEHPRVRAARDRLIAQLDSLGRLSPGHDWIAGQRVRYLVEHGRLDAAARAGAECGGTPWWCLALSGYVHHAARRFAPADSLFAAALARAPQADRCAWTDLSWVLDEVPREYRRAPCDRRRALEERIWWLADPLYLTPGNERRTEHYARHVLSRFQDQARSGYAVRWGDDLDELLIRYGWPAGWERNVSRRGYDGGGRSIISHHAPRSREFMPTRQFITDPATITQGGWDIDPDRPRSTYAPPYARSFETLRDPQVGVFRRGTSAVVVAAFDVKADEREGTWAGDPGTSGVNPLQGEATGEAALVFLPGPITPAIASRSMGPGPFRLALTIPWQPGLVSLEAVGWGDSARAARSRWWLPLSGGASLAVSDPLLFDAPGPDSLANTLEEVFSALRTDGVVRAGDRVGVYWETRDWGDQPVVARFSLTVTRTGEGWLRRAARTLRLAGRNQPSVSLGWTEVLDDAPAVHPRSLALGLPDGPGGAYVLRIEVRVAEQTAWAERRLMVERR